MVLISHFLCDSFKEEESLKLCLCSKIQDVCLFCATLTTSAVQSVQYQSEMYLNTCSKNVCVYDTCDKDASKTSKLEKWKMWQDVTDIKTTFRGLCIQ